jgi:enoyl-CoA hydratase/carnithine racemase
VSELVSFEVEARIARIVLNRPDARNALNSRMLVELADAMSAADTAEDVDVVILTGEGSAFCVRALRRWWSRRHATRNGSGRGVPGLGYRPATH